MLGILVPEVKGAVAACSAEGPMNRVEGYSIHRVDMRDITVVRWGLPMTSKGEVEAAHKLVCFGDKSLRGARICRRVRRRTRKKRKWEKRGRG